MTHTLVASATRQHIIGFDRPFTVIGERINPTGRKKLAAEMQAGNFETVIKDGLAQVAAGAHILDINAGVTAVNPNETEPPLMRRMIDMIGGGNEGTEAIIDRLQRTKSNEEFLSTIHQDLV